MAAYVARRALGTLPTLVLITLIVFGLMRVTGGDPIAIMLGPQATDQLIREVREELGLNRPMTQQYTQWLGRLVRGELGKSIRTREKVVDVIHDRISTTIYLAIAATLFSTAIGIFAGIVSALRRGGWLDQGIMLLSILGLSVPNYFLALLLILVFGVLLQWVPIAAFSVNLLEEPLQASINLVMPMVALGAGYAALMARMTRSSMLEVLGSDYIRTALAKGLPPSRVIGKHALKNAMIPIATLTALNFAQLLGGSIIIEEIFGLPGLGALLVRAVFERDFPVIQAVTLLIGVAYVFTNLLTDILYGVLDPRIQYQ